MYKVYFKQTIELLKQNKFISIISIAGTALAIMMVMVLIVVDHVKNADISPENNRSDLLYIDYSSLTGKTKQWTMNGPLKWEHVELLKNHLKSAKKISASDGITMDYFGRTSRPKDSKVRISLDTRGVDTDYWKLFSLDFIAGAPFDQADFNSGLRKTVICESIADQFYGKGNAIGKKIIIENEEYTITGVVKDISKALKHAYAEAWIPYTSITNYRDNLHFQVFLLVDRSKIQDVEKEVRAIEEVYNQTDEEFNLKLLGPYNHRDSQINVWQLKENKKIANRRLVFLFSILLLIPAINLSGLSLSRVRRRIEEIGIRKAFGAKKRTILIQVLYENFITSLLGGIIGVMLSLFIVSLMKEWLLGATDTSAIPLNALISLPILVTVVVVSFVLNLLSSGIPAWHAASINIVDSLNRKK